MEDTAMIENLRPLTQEQRQGARKSARNAVIRALGSKPTREQFTHTTISRYPLSVTRLISLLCMVLLLAAFTPSAIRLYVIGSQTFGQAVPNDLAQVAVGLATVLSAEIGQVVFSLALATLGTSTTSRRLLYLSMGMCTSVALAGNVQVALLGHGQSVFAWLKAIVPPLVVLSTAYVLKGQMLETIEQRHAAEYAYQSALVDWQALTAEPEQLPDWHQFHANALQDALRKVNARRKETLAAMTQADWRLVVYREMQADLWYAEPQETERPTNHAALDLLDDLSSPRRNGNSAVPKVIAAASGAV
jgi:hypothetical protein